MQKLLFIYLTILYLSSISNCLFLQKQNTISQNINHTVIGVFEVIRHGARTPIGKGSTSNFYFGTMRSQLTINGLRQHLLLGRWIRERYIEGKVSKLFKKSFEEMNIDELEIISSHRQRSIFSSASHILGMFPNALIKLNLEGHLEIKNDDIPPIKNFEFDARDGREIVINVLHGTKDTMFKAAYCHIGDEKDNLIVNIRKEKKDIFLIEENDKKSAIDEIINLYSDVVGVDGVDLVNNKYSYKTFKHMISFLAPFKYHYIRNLNFSKKTRETIAKFVLNKFYNIRLEETKYKKIVASRINELLLNFFVNKVKKKTIKKFYLLSGFDNTISDIIANLLDPEYLRSEIIKAVDNIDTFNFLVPPVASNFIFELIQDDNNKEQYYVRIIYNGKIINANFIKKVKIYDEMIDFNDFISLLRSRIDVDYEKLKCDIQN